MVGVCSAAKAQAVLDAGAHDVVDRGRGSVVADVRDVVEGGIDVHFPTAATADLDARGAQLELGAGVAFEGEHGAGGECNGEEKKRANGKGIDGMRTMGS